MAGTARADLLSKLRSRLSDDRASVSAFSLQVTGKCKAAFLEISNGILTVTVEQGNNVFPVRLNLSDPRYNTVKRLIDFFDNTTGYEVKPDQSYIISHPSDDLYVEGMPDIYAGPGDLKHRMFSNEELNDVLMEAITLHNPNYTTITTVPKAEYPYVLYKALAQCYRILAVDTAKRKGLDTDAKTFLSLAKDMEEQYARDHKKHERILPAPKADESKMGAGDVVNGMMFRRNLRAGYNSSYRNSLPPQPPNLYDPADDDVEDNQIRLRWSQNREQSFSYYEVWRDTQPDVERSISGRLVNAFPNNSAAVGGGPDLPISTQYSRSSTAKQVLGVSAGANRISPIFDGFFFWTAAELAGSNIVNATFIDGLLFNNPGSGLDSILGMPLEPNTDYYYRVYALNWNGEVVQSKVLKFTTKSQRSKFKRIPNGTSYPSNTQNGVLASDAISPLAGPLSGGTLITIKGNASNFPATGLTILLNGKPCTNFTFIDSNTITVESPQFTNTDWIGTQVDMVMISPNGLKDIILRAWSFNGP